MHVILAHKDGANEQLLRDHAYNTASLARDFACEIEQGDVLFLLGLFHDIGKADPLFQQKLTTNPDTHVDHSYAGARYTFTNIMQIHGYDIFTDTIAYVIAAHHGMFNVYEPEVIYTNKLFARMDLKEGYDYTTVTNFAHELERELPQYGYRDLKHLIEKAYLNYQEAIKKLHPKDETEEKFYQGAFVRLYLGFLKNADILDTINAYRQELQPRTLAEKTVLNHHYLSAIEAKYSQFANPTTALNQTRTLLANTIKNRGALDTAGIYRLDLPTGAGKTNLSMRYAFHQMVYQNKSRFLYVAPFLSILEQNAAEIRRTVGDSGLTEHHSNAIIDDSVLGRYCTDSWDDQIVLTTMVQFFQTLFKTRSGNVRRFANLTNSVIVLDEVQSLPISVTHNFNLIANFMAYVMKTTLVLCTATQPLYNDPHVSHKLIYGGHNWEHPDLVTMTDLERKSFERTSITKFKSDDSNVNLTEIANAIVSKAGSVLAIVNTKKTVANLYDLISQKTTRRLFYLSTNMCAQHRLDLLKEIKACLAQNEPIICISTQLIEAGVDVDFKYVFRSYAGLDSLVQANGRCNREGLRSRGHMTIFNLGSADENITHLADIKSKKQAATKVLAQQPQVVDLTSLNNDFYQYYFANNAHNMNFALKNPGESVLDYLSKNEYHAVERGALTQAFKTAGKEMNLIDDNTVTVFVTYKNDALLDQLRDLSQIVEKTPSEMFHMKHFLKELQRYTINVFPDDKLLDNCQVYGEIYILPKNHYDFLTKNVSNCGTI